MSDNTQVEVTQRELRFWQQNVNGSLLGHQDLLVTLGQMEYDICAVQEPYIGFNGKSQANSYWRLVYPSTRAPERQVACSLLLVSTSISTNAWAEVPVHSSDVTAIRLHLDGGHILFIFNIYLACTHNEAL
ncbi:hypothetical protein BDQ17DRAFT_1239415 [Cyathus striatus]|nr:hypothetical protein BDQ17DRAFT_1267787 [Cyathus striatus]KAF9006208.1 hypothetical protein BDQ17DRAFT_1239415 [Cyathus striatus]